MRVSWGSLCPNRPSRSKHCKPGAIWPSQRLRPDECDTGHDRGPTQGRDLIPNNRMALAGVPDAHSGWQAQQYHHCFLTQLRSMICGMFVHSRTRPSQQATTIYQYEGNLLAKSATSLRRQLSKQRRRFWPHIARCRCRPALSPTNSVHATQSQFHVLPSEQTLAPVVE